MTNFVLDLLFPRRCGGCGALGSYICPKCQKTLIFLPQLCPECDKQAIDGITHPYCVKRWGLDGLVSVFRYQGIVKKLIKQIKYRFVYDMAETLINQIPKDTYSFLPKTTLIYPIPLHKDRQRWRGFNQAEKLGKFLSLQLKLDIADGLLTRVQKREPQVNIASREDRIKNAQGLFELKTKNLPSEILLFDDVWTTGATMKEASKVLKRARVKKVWGMTMAR